MLIPEGWAHAVHNLDDTVAMTYNFVDESNLGCYLESMRSKVGALLLKLFGQLHQGRGKADAARAFSQHSALAYYAHLLKQVAGSAGAAQATVRAEHEPWEDFFAQQGPFATGGVQALQAEADALARSMLEFVEASPPPVEAALESADTVLARFATTILQSASRSTDTARGTAAQDAPDSPGAGHDEL